MGAALAGVVVAHQGGWDEILLVIGPIVLIALLLRVARRRALGARQVSETREMSAPSEANRPTRSS